MPGSSLRHRFSTRQTRQRAPKIETRETERTLQRWTNRECDVELLRLLTVLQQDTIEHEESVVSHDTDRHLPRWSRDLWYNIQTRKITVRTWIPPPCVHDCKMQSHQGGYISPASAGEFRKWRGVQLALRGDAFTAISYRPLLSRFASRGRCTAHARTHARHMRATGRADRARTRVRDARGYTHVPFTARYRSILAFCRDKTTCHCFTHVSFADAFLNQVKFNLIYIYIFRL